MRTKLVILILILASSLLSVQWQALSLVGTWELDPECAVTFTQDGNFIQVVTGHPKEGLESSYRVAPDARGSEYLKLTLFGPGGSEDWTVHFKDKRTMEMYTDPAKPALFRKR